MQVAGRGGWALARVRKMRNLAFILQRGKCYYCEVQMTQGDDPPVNTTCTAEHLKPLADGGRNHGSNIVAACMRCNCSIHNKTEASAINERLQKLNIINPQPIKNMAVAHALIAAFGYERIREILRQAAIIRRENAA